MNYFAPGEPVTDADQNALFVIRPLGLCQSCKGAGLEFLCSDVTRWTVRCGDDLTPDPSRQPLGRVMQFASDIGATLSQTEARFRDIPFTQRLTITTGLLGQAIGRLDAQHVERVLSVTLGVMRDAAIGAAMEGKATVAETGNA